MGLQLKEYVIVSLVCFVTVFIMSLSASGGGVWSSSVIGDTYFNGTIHIANYEFEFGLTGYQVSVGDFVQYFDYSEEEEKLRAIWGRAITPPYPKTNATSSPELWLDYQDAKVGGRTTTAFLAFGIIFSLISIVLHLQFWPFNKNVLLVHRVVLFSTSLLVLSFLIAFLSWNALGHTAAERIALDKYAAATPDTKRTVTLPIVDRGWCYSLSVVCCVFSLIAGIPSYFAQKLSLERPEVFDALVDSGSSFGSGGGEAAKPASGLAAGQTSYGGEGETNAYGYDEM